MKIAPIANYLKNSGGGGVKTYLVDLVNALQNKKTDINESSGLRTTQSASASRGVGEVMFTLLEALIWGIS